MATIDRAREASSFESSGLEVTALSAGYGRKIVLEGITFSVPRGQTAALLGINGAGKTTILKTLVGLLRPISGLIWLDGKDVTARAVAENACAGLVLVPEGAKSFTDLSVRENLEMGGFVLGDRALLQSRIDEALDFFPRLRERLSQKAGVLSGGERQMLSIGRALMLRPRVLLLDEPFLGLAPIMIQEVARRLGDLVKATNCGLLIAEQHIGATLQFSHRAFAVRERSFLELSASTAGVFDEEEVASVIFGADDMMVDKM